MKKIIYLLLAGIAVFFAGCKKNLDVPPTNIINDADIFSSVAGIDGYMARIYSQIPMEDFKWNPSTGFKAFFNGSFFSRYKEAIILKTSCIRTFSFLVCPATAFARSNKR